MLLLHGDTVVEHVACEVFTVDKNDPSVTVPVSCLHCFGLEARGGDEDSKVSSVRIEGTDEVTDVRIADLVFVLVAFGLNVDVGQPECVLANDSIDAAVSGFPNMLFLALSPAITHGPQQLNNSLFKELW